MTKSVIKKIPKFKAFEIINNLKLFEDLTPDEKHMIADNQTLFHLIPEGETFITEGELDSCFYLLLSGRARVGQNRIEFDELSAGDIVGVTGFIRDLPRTGSVKAESDILALKFSRFQFKKLPANVRELIKDHMIEELVRRIDRLNHQFHHID